MKHCCVSVGSSYFVCLYRFLFLVLHLTEIMRDELAGGSSVPARVFHFPALAEDPELFGRENYAVGSQVVVDEG